MKTIVKLALTIVILATITCTARTKNNNHPNDLILNTDSKPIIKQSIKIALLLDTSNSMDGLIDQAKTQLWEIVNELSYAKCGGLNPDLQIALYEYGNDGLESSDGFIRQVLNFSSDLDEISEKLFSLTTNGGSEYCGEVIQTTLDQLNWGSNDTDLKIIFIAGNENFTQGKINYIDATANASEKDVIVNTIFCGNHNNGILGKWQDGARRTGGEYLSINQNQQIIHIATPYDKIIIQLNAKLNSTYISYGNEGKTKLHNQVKQDFNAQELEEVVLISRAVTKSSRIYKNKTWDLVDAEEDKNFRYDSLDKKTLPKELQNKTTDELKKYVQKQREKRIKIQNEINDLNYKRKTYITNNKKETSIDETLNSAMIKAIKKQAQRKNYTWD